jgi:AraC-like DNA-binding protein
LGSGVVVFDGVGGAADRHRHDALQLVVGCDAPVVVRTDIGAVRVAATIVPSQVDHALVATGRTVLVLVEPAGAVGAAVAGVAADHIGVDLGPRLAGLPPPPAGDADGSVAWSRRALAHLTGLAGDVDLSGGRPEVRDAARFVDEHLDGSPRLGDAAARVGLSPRQLRRLIDADLGMPFRRYVLWRRLRRAVLAVRGGDDLTTAAATAGFADSAHFSRVFRSMFGLAPSEVLPFLDVAHAELDTAP